MRRSIALSLIAGLTATLVTAACQRSSDQSSPETATADSSSSVPDDVRQRRAAVERVIADNRPNFDAFDSGSLGDASLEMIPFVVYRVLQELEPAAFGSDALESNGFFARADSPTGQNGIVWTKPTSPDGTFQLRYMTRTCASCHTGRVRLNDGSVRLTHGGANTEMNVHRFIGTLTSTLRTSLTASNDTPAYQAFRKRILDALASKPAEWYWGAKASVSPADATAEVATVTTNIDAVLTRMRAMNDRRLGGLALLQKFSYSHAANPPSLTDGAPGLVETSGLGATALVPLVGMDKAAAVLPPGPSKADIPAVWMIDPNGYANWDGTVRGFARSLTSSLAVVGDAPKIDIPTNALIQSFLGKLPAEPYPFPIDQAARARGAATYKTNCAGCHVSPAGKTRNELVSSVDADMRRADAIRSVAVPLLAKVVLSICPATQPECHFDAQGPVVDPGSDRGYIASPLTGVWAVAPYLHNGSVPTLRQLLVPSLRTASPFLRGSVSYNQRDGGWEWEPAMETDLRARGDKALALHDPRQDGFAPVGHGSASQQTVTDEKGASVRIAWSDGAADRQVVDDLIAYLLSL